MSVASYIDVSNVKETIPITSQIRIEIIFGQCTLTKSNMVDFVVYSFETDEEDIEMLVNEDKLRKFLSYSTRDTILIVESENSFIFDDGTNKPIHAKEIFKFSDFPSIPKLKPENSIVFDKKLISMLNVAKIFVSTDELRPTFLYVHIKEDMIFSTTLVLNYTNKVGKPYTDNVISLTPKECKLMDNFERVDYYFNDNFSILKCGDIYYGCRIKSDVKDMSESFINFNKTIQKNKYIKILIADFYNFCNSTIINIKGIKDCFVNANLEIISNSEIKLSFIDEGVLNNTIVINAQIKDMPIGYKFSFSQSDLFQLLGTLPYQNICISPLENNENQIGIWSDKDENLIVITSKMKNL